MHAFALANAAREFADRVSDALKRLDLIPRKLVEIALQDDLTSLSREWRALCSRASDDNEVVFGKFFLYNKDEDVIVS